MNIDALGFSRQIMLDPYRTLGVAPFASRREIREAYCRLVKWLHPDIGPQNATNKELLYQVNAAYSYLRRVRALDANDSKKQVQRGEMFASTARKASIVFACVLAPAMILIPTGKIHLDAVNSYQNLDEAFSADAGEASESAHRRWILSAAATYMRPGNSNETRNSMTPSAKQVDAEVSTSVVTARTTPTTRKTLIALALQDAIPVSLQPEQTATTLAPREMIQTEKLSGADILPPALRSVEPADAINAVAAVVTYEADASLQNKGERKRRRLFRDARYGLAVPYSKDLLPNQQFSRDALDRLFRSRDGQALLRIQTIVVDGSPTAAAKLSSRLDSRVSGIPAKSDLRDKGGFVLRGTYGNEAYVERLDLSCSGRLAHRTLLIYPESAREEFASIAEDLATRVIVTNPLGRSCSQGSVRADVTR